MVKKFKNCSNAWAWPAWRL